MSVLLVIDCECAMRTLDIADGPAKRGLRVLPGVGRADRAGSVVVGRCLRRAAGPNLCGPRRDEVEAARVRSFATGLSV